MDGLPAQVGLKGLLPGMNENQFSNRTPVHARVAVEAIPDSDRLFSGPEL
jgi:hypothetical protein